MSEFSIGARLLSVSKFVRRGARFADVGTDHAYLPVFLLESGVISHAVCSDINRGPLENARKNAEAHGMLDKLTLVLADGAERLNEFHPTDVAICGMGGELIARIIDNAPFLKNDGVRLILQPMSRQEVLREYLNENGFSVIGEDYAVESGKSYLVIAVEYVGSAPERDVQRVRYGSASKSSPDAQREYLTSKLKSKRCAYGGLLRSGTADEELALDIKYIEALLSSLE